MSYLTLDKNLNMNKVTISLWFRVPAASAAACAAKFPPFFYGFKVMNSVIPLIAWGQNIRVQITDTELFFIGYFPNNPNPQFGERVSGSHESVVSPSFIGVRVDRLDPPTLDVHIQTADHGNATNTRQLVSGFYIADDGAPVFTYTDASYMTVEAPEYFGNSDADSSNSRAGHPLLEVDHWQHVLISWQLLAHSSTNPGAASKMWCAVNDVNKTGAQLPAMCDPLLGMAENDHMAWNPYYYIGDEFGASVSVAISQIPAAPLSIPGPPLVSWTTAEGIADRNPIEMVELAELQIFCDTTLDTGVVANRRAFIDDEGKPVPPDAAEKLMGKKPEVLLHGSGNWIKGINTGSDAAQLTPTGKIIGYSPDPSLHGPQGEAV